MRTRVAGLMNIFNDENDFRLPVAEPFTLLPGGELVSCGSLRKTGYSFTDLDGPSSCKGRAA